ncbi:MAG: glutathione binding-like protein, partial [Kofleriaceae bacterium]
PCWTKLLQIDYTGRYKNKEDPMELYFSPLACSLATRIALYEAGAPARFTRVDQATKRTEDGRDFLAINPLGLVPVLRTADGEVVTENAAILQLVGEGTLVPTERPARTQLQQWLSFISTELHKGIYGILFDRSASEEVKQFARARIPARFERLATHLTDREYLLDQFSVADAYLATVFAWTQAAGPKLGDWPVLAAYQKRLLARPAVARAFGEELAMYTAERKA